jgi:hypothetical protein
MNLGRATAVLKEIRFDFYETSTWASSNFLEENLYYAIMNYFMV